jgi:hypothetical protein
MRRLVISPDRYKKQAAHGTLLAIVDNDAAQSTHGGNCMENRILYEGDLSSSASSTNLYDPAEPLHTHSLPDVDPSSGTRGSLKTRVHDMKERVMPFVDEKLHSAKVKANDAIQTAKLRTSDTIQTAKIKSTDAKIKARSFIGHVPPLADATQQTPRSAGGGNPARRRGCLVTFFGGRGN